MNRSDEGCGAEPGSELEEIFDDANGDLALGDLDSAIEKYRRCIAIDPAFFDGWHALAMALMKSGHIIEAIDAGKNAVRLQPNDQLAWSSLSMFFVRNHQIKEAEAAGAKAKVLSWGGRLDPVAVVQEMEAWPVAKSQISVSEDKAQSGDV